MTAHRHHSTKKQLAAASTALLLASPVAACGSKEAPSMCESPRAASSLFPADPNATADRSTWENGIAIGTEVPPDALGVVVGYRGPNAAAWVDSFPISPDRARTIAVRLGNDAVLFSVAVIAPEGSPACGNPPDVTFSDVQPILPIIATDAALPEW